MLVFAFVVTGLITIASISGTIALIVYVYSSRRRNLVIKQVSAKKVVLSSNNVIPISTKVKYRPENLSIEQKDILQELLEELRDANRKFDGLRQVEINVAVPDSRYTKKREQFVRENDSSSRIIDISQANRLREALAYGNHG